VTDGGAYVKPTALISNQVKEMETHCITEYKDNKKQLPCWCLEKTKQNHKYTMSYLQLRCEHDVYKPSSMVQSLILATGERQMCSVFNNLAPNIRYTDHPVRHSQDPVLTLHLMTFLMQFSFKVQSLFLSVGI